jgi:cytochrome b561
VAILHAVAALKHHFIDRDNVLRRMLPIKLRDETI